MCMWLSDMWWLTVSLWCGVKPTGGVEHDHDGWMFLHEAIEGFVCQVEDGRICLGPGHLWSLWLRWLRADKNFFFFKTTKCV